MIYFILFTVINVVPIFIEPLQLQAISLTLVLTLLILIVKIVFPRMCMALYRFSVSITEAVKYRFFYDFVFIPLYYLLFFGILIVKDKRLVLALYYCMNMSFFCIYPALRFFIPKIRAYLQIKKVCQKRGYRLSATLSHFLFPNEKSSSPEMLIETPEETLSVRVMGSSGEPLKYVFLNEKEYTVQKIDRYVAKFIMDLENEADGDTLVYRLAQRCFMKKKQVKTLAALNTNGKKILLFCPDYAFCKDEKSRRIIEIGNELYDYSVYDVKNFVRGKLRG